MRFYSFLLLIAFILGSKSQAATYTSIADGDWDDPKSWILTAPSSENWKPSTPPNYNPLTDTIIIRHNIKLTIDVQVGYLIIEKSGNLNGSSKSLAVHQDGYLQADGKISLLNFSIYENSTAIINNTLSVSSNLQNNGILKINGKADIKGDINNNVDAEFFIDALAIVDIKGNLNGNSDNTLIKNEGQINIEGDINNNVGSTFLNEGSINSKGVFYNNGGTFENLGFIKVEKGLTHHHGYLNNSGGMIIEQKLQINEEATFDGNGVLRVNNITNWGKMDGSNDVCSIDDETPTNYDGNPASITTTFCTRALAEVLPVTLLYIEAKTQGQYFYFKWATQSEVNNNYFTLKFSQDGEQFSEIVKIQGNGTKNTLSEYHYRYLPTTETSKVYFRLKQTDFDGRSEYFKPIYLNQINHKPTNEITIYPNPVVNNNLNIELNQVEAGIYNIRLFSISGQLIIDKQVEIYNNSLSTKFNILEGKPLEKGIYFIQLNGKNKDFTQKVIVQ